MITADRPALMEGRSEPLVIAHRGASRAAPGNSLAAFEAAVAAQADAVELDVRRTADGVLVVHHAAQRHGIPVAKLSYEELTHSSRHRPPRLEEVVQLCAGRTGLDVEIKQSGCETEALDMVSQRFAPEELLLTSFHDEVITSVKRSRPRVRCGLLLGPGRMRARNRRYRTLPVTWAERCGADFLVMHQVLAPHLRRRRLRAAPPGVLSSAQESECPVLIWTVNSPERMAGYLSDPRVAGIITDLPEVAVDLRRRLGTQA